MGIARRFAGNSLYQFGSNLFAKAAALFVLIALTWLLTPDEFGIYSWIVAIAVLADVFASFGTGNATGKFIPDALAKGDKGKAASYFRYFLKLRLIGVSLFFILLFFFSRQIVSLFFGKPELAVPLQVAAVFLAVYNISAYLRALFVSVQENKYIFWSNIVESFLKLSLMIGLVIVMASFYGAVAGYVAALAAGALYLFLAIRKRYHFLLGKGTEIDHGRLNKYLASAILGTFSLVLLTNMDVLMLSALSTMANVGFYRMSLGWVAALIGLLPVYLVFPVFSEVAATSMQNLRHVFDLFTKYMAIAFALLTLGVALVSKNLVALLYSSEYAPVAPLLETMSLLVILNSLTIFLVTLYNAIEKPFVHMGVFIVAIIVNVILNYFLILEYGAMGAAYATIITYILICAALLLVLKKYAGFRTGIKFLMFPSLAALIPYLVFREYAFSPDLLISAGAMALAALIYVALLFLVRHLSISEVKYLLSRVLEPAKNK